MKLVLLNYLEGRLSLNSTFIKLMMMSSVLLLLPYSLLKEMGKAKKKENIYGSTLYIFSVKQTWIWSFQSFLVGICITKKTLKKIIKCFCIVFFFYDLYFKLDHLGYKKQGHMF